MSRYLYILLILVLSVIPLNAKIDSEPRFTVVIDAGHGGKDIGATDNGVREKDINLKVAKYLENLIKKKMKNTGVVMTRDDDTYLTLQQRADKANKAKGDIFISIHTNSVDKKNKNRRNVAGSSVYTLGLHKDENNLEVARRENSVIELEQNYEQKYSGFDPQSDESYIIFEMAQKKNLSQSIQLADQIQKELVNSGRQERGVHQAGFWVLWATSMPSVLVELDFICNPTSAKYISSDKGAKELAEAIFKAIQTYEASWRKNISGVFADNLTDTYSEGESSSLEESFVELSGQPVAKAKTRTSKNPSATVSLSPSKSSNKGTQRRRRSKASRALSLNTSYEEGKIKFPETTTYYDGKATDEEVILAAIETSPQDNVKSDNKKGKKNKEKSIKSKEKKKSGKEKSRKATAHNAKINRLVTVYKIQILASADLLSQGNSRFCGLSPISTYKENNLYKYYYGESTSKEEVETMLSEVRKKIPDAFIVSTQKSVQSN